MALVLLAGISIEVATFDDPEFLPINEDKWAYVCFEEYYFIFLSWGWFGHPRPAKEPPFLFLLFFQFFFVFNFF
jgi:hypothetical protein